MEQQKDFFTILQEYKQALRADESFDVVTRVFLVSNKNAVIFFVDGMIKDETMQKLMQEFAKIKPEDMPKEETEFAKNAYSYKKE